MKQLILSAVTLIAAHAAFAQTPPEPPRPPVPPSPVMRHELMFVAGSQLDRERIVQGAPYCADAVHETVQTLADGNRIVQRQSSRQCRDGQGRTRQETAGGRGRHVFLRDPVAKESWMLDPEARQAVRLDAMRGMGHPIPDPGMIERIREWSRELRDRMRSRPDASLSGSAATPDAAERQHILIREVRKGDMAGPPPMPMPMPSMALHTRFMGPRGPGSTNSLPSETIEGLKADGSRTTWTIEAGRIGNEKPIQIVSEAWTSPDLGITVRSRDVDPVVGENNFRLQNVVRGEPDAALFKVPAEYKKVEASAMAFPPLPPVPPFPPVPPVPPAARP